MKKIISYLKPYTFTFNNVLNIINRPLWLSFINYAFMIFVLSFLYHFDTGLHLSLSDSIFNFLKSFVVEITISTIFYAFVMYCIYIFFNNKINESDKCTFSFINLINLFSHLYIVSFLLDISLFILFNNFDMTDNTQLLYVIVSILISVLINIIYPILFLSYLYKKDKFIYCEFKKNNSDNIKYNIFIKYFDAIKEFILLKHEFVLKKISNCKFIYIILIFICFSFIASLFTLGLNPYFINHQSINVFTNYTFNEILFNYVNLLKVNGLYFLLFVMFYSYYLMNNIKCNSSKFKLKNLFNNIKTSSPIFFINLLLLIVHRYQIKLSNMSFFKPKLLPTQMIGVLVAPLYYFTVAFMVIFILKKLLFKYYKIK